jgi:CheY-like chemotaxis protein
MLCTGDETTTREGPRHRRGGPFTAPTDGIPILIVDDDAHFCTAVSRALASVPFLPFSVRGGVDALRFLARAAPFQDAPRPAFVVLDFNLPDLDAPAVLADMRAHPLHRAIPVLVLSQIPGPADENAALQAGAQAYQAKPSHAAALRELLLGFWCTHSGPHGHPGR